MKIKKRKLTQAKLAREIAQRDPERYGSWYTHDLGFYLENVLFGESDIVDPLSPEDYQTLIKMLATIEAENEFCYLWMALARFDCICSTTLFDDLTAELFGPGIDHGAWADEHPDNPTPPAKEKYQLIAQAGA